MHQHTTACETFKIHLVLTVSVGATTTRQHYTFSQTLFIWLFCPEFQIESVHCAHRALQQRATLCRLALAGLQGMYPLPSFAPQAFSISSPSTEVCSTRLQPRRAFAWQSPAHHASVPLKQVVHLWMILRHHTVISCLALQLLCSKFASCETPIHYCMIAPLMSVARVKSPSSAGLCGVKAVRGHAASDAIVAASHASDAMA